MAVDLRAQDLVKQRLPSLRIGPGTTTSDSTHNIWFTSTLGSWNKFESEVRQEFLATTWSPEVLAFGPQNHGPNHVSYEQLCCGDEHSVVARFGQNVEHVMTAVYQSLNIGLRFGDAKTCIEMGNMEKDIPDIVLITSGGNVRIIGEAKTPWKHNISDKLKTDMNGFRHYLGQISKYMYLGKVKYGFWTNYQQTIFLKQEPHPTRRNRWVLWHSPVILYETSSTLLPKDDFRSPSLYRGKVSLRECFLFLARKVHLEGHGAINAMDSKQWSGSLYRGPGDGSDYIPDDSSDSGSSGGSLSKSSEKRSTPREPRQPRKPRESREPREPRESRQPRESREPRRPVRDPSQPAARTRPSTRSESRMAQEMRELESSTRQLTLGSRARHESRARGTVTVYLDEESNQWYYKDSRGTATVVDLLQDQDDETYYFMVGRKRYNARLDKGKRRHR